MAKKAMKKGKVQMKDNKMKKSMGLAIAALILNVFILPGLGTLIGGKTKTGVWQIVIAILSIPLMVIFVGFITFFLVWVWGIISAARLIEQAK